MVNICLCDDDKDILNYYCTIINKICVLNNRIINLEIFESGEGLLFEIEENIQKFDIIIIDIFMKKLNGIETAKMLRTYGYTGILIFLTSSDEFALEAFGVESLNYIIKDENQIKRFESVFLKAVMQIEDKKNNKIIVYSNKQRKILDLDNIEYMESVTKKINIYYSTKKIEKINYTLNEILEQTNKYGFIRCHKSYIVNINYILSFNKMQCVLKNDIIIPIGRKYYNSFKEEFSIYEFKSMEE